MDIGELYHLLFRWLHVTSAFVWVRHLLSVMAPAVILLMVSNHFPLVYGTSRPWLMAPTLVALGWAPGLAIRWLSLRRLTLRWAEPPRRCAARPPGVLPASRIFHDGHTTITKSARCLQIS